MNAPLLSIITTSLNRRELLQKTLESVLGQTWDGVEQLVVDGGSTDGTIELLREFEARFKKRKYGFAWVSEKDSGQSEAMNKGLRMATGNFVMILNSDDYLEPDALAAFMGKFAQSPEVDILYGNHKQVFEDGSSRVVTHRLYALKDVVSRGYEIPQSAAIMRRSLVDRVGGFNTELRHVAEHDLFVRMLKAGAAAAYIPHMLQITLEHAGRKTTANAVQAWRETKRVNFSHGAGHFSRFYFLYLKEVYFGGVFRCMERRTPRLRGFLKRLFYRVSR